jgi:hypothetical protein
VAAAQRIHGLPNSPAIAGLRLEMSREPRKQPKMCVRG